MTQIEFVVCGTRIKLDPGNIQANLDSLISWTDWLSSAKKELNELEFFLTKQRSNYYLDSLKKDSKIAEWKCKAGFAASSESEFINKRIYDAQRSVTILESVVFYLRCRLENEN
jgi:hypothetical protein